MQPTIQRRLALQCRHGLIGPAWLPVAPSALKMLRQAAMRGWVQLRAEPGSPHQPAREAMQARLTRVGLMLREQWEQDAVPRATPREAAKIVRLPLPADTTEGAR